MSEINAFRRLDRGRDREAASLRLRKWNRSLARSVRRFDPLLDVVHHRYCSNENDSRDYLVRMKTGVKETPGDTDRGERLHHFEVTRCGCAGEMQALKIKQERNPA